MATLKEDLDVLAPIGASYLESGTEVRLVTEYRDTLLIVAALQTFLVDAYLYYRAVAA